MPKSIFATYYRKDLKDLYLHVVPRGAKKLIVKNEKLSKGKWDYVILDDIVGDLEDIQSFLTKCKKLLKEDGRLVITYYNNLWQPFLKLASLMGLRKQFKYEQNWLNEKDIENLLALAGLESVTTGKRFLFPIPIPVISDIINKAFSSLPLVSTFALTTYVIAKPFSKDKKEYSVSIIVPAKNEEGNIARIVPSIPTFGKSQEVIFIEGDSKDNTWREIQKVLKSKTKINTRAFKQRGRGKANAVRLGFSRAKGEILMIYDADRTVNPKDLPKFYKALSSGVGEFANGSRLVYPMEKEAMRTLNKAANKLFSIVFSWILGQMFRDTLCGTKAIFKKHYKQIKRLKDLDISRDPFGDFTLIFGAVKLNLKVVEIPVRYKEREYGSPNISRFKHGLLLLKMTIRAYLKFKTF